MRTISGEILTDKLVETLMRTAIQHADVERGVLIVRRAEEARVEAEATMRRGAIVVRRLDTLPERSDLPDTVVRYVLRTHETVLLDDASSPNPFSTDPHVAEHRVRSLLCLPLVNRGTLIGALYFEDRAASHVFTASRIGILRLLASQAAIALENARLYAQLRSENSLLREELHKTSTFELRRTIDAIPHGITVLGPDGSTLGANTFMLDYTGLSLEEVTDEDSRVRRFHPDDVARLE
ncbi:MAG TPA: GAF domain-containing protein, partial [Thermoplasmata archaeon]|nr:GAF domain-containing protein [Thermoplasmata archaeon]